MVALILGWAKHIKTASIVANWLILFGGMICFLISVSVLESDGFDMTYEPFLGSHNYRVAGATIAVSGVFMAMAAMLGIYATLKEQKRALLTYIICLIIGDALMIVGGIHGYNFRSTVEQELHGNLVRSVPQYGRDPAITEAWDATHVQFKCCGIAIHGRRGMEAWVQLNDQFKSQRSPKIPATCCQSDLSPFYGLCQGTNPDQRSAYVSGCYEDLRNAIKKHAVLLGVMSIILAFLLVIGASLSTVLYFLITFEI